METIKIPNTDLEVSRLALVVWVWAVVGKQMSN